MKYIHKPVLVKEVLKYLNLESNYNVIDGTIGGGGHAYEILKNTIPQGKLIGFDRDPRAIEEAGKKLKKYNKRVTLINDSYQNINKYLNKNKNGQRSNLHINGLLLDLGVSSAQMEPEEPRGFSYQSKEALDMRFGPDTDLTANYILNNYKKEDLIKIFKEFGEERLATKIANKIILFREETPFDAASDLTSIVNQVYRSRYSGRSKTHPATRIFQALRIAVNNELGVLENSLENILNILPSGARVVVISFHSLEDRIVKKFINYEAKECICPVEIPVCRCNKKKKVKIITKKPITPTTLEIKNNPRSRSAKLRAFEVI